LVIKNTPERDKEIADSPIFGMISRILKSAGSKEVYIFGSAAHGDIERANDIDIAIRGLPPELFFKVMGKIQMALSKQVDLVDLDEDNAFTRYLEEENELVRIG
jgi:predicted nucleotidyltransferase